MNARSLPNCFLFYLLTVAQRLEMAEGACSKLQAELTKALEGQEALQKQVGSEGIIRRAVRSENGSGEAVKKSPGCDQIFLDCAFTVKLCMQVTTLTSFNNQLQSLVGGDQVCVGVIVSI